MLSEPAFLGGVIPARIQTVEPPRVLSWQWPQGAAGEEPDDSNAALVEFTVTEDDSIGGTRLTMVESGFAHLGLPTDEATDRHRANSRNRPGKLDQLGADCEQTTV
ncbi:hypothetical protein [Streptomyces alanosinicus]|uniref:hypothetical protein n=1 Tax=Streptomyces alanosinicus TaxID=68171 RepID=UPI00167BD7F8|nr:hypothetical protein [Streptomyces alanosinicus]